MKKIKFLVAVLALATAAGLTSCKKKGDKNADTQTEGNTPAAQAEAASTNEAMSEDPGESINVLFSGNIDPKEYTPGQEATVSISRFPRTLGEFKALQKKLGAYPQGAVMLQLAAFELYNRNTEAGTEAIKLNNVESNVNSVLRIIQDKFGKTQYDDMLTPYLVATYLDGATPQNGYNPNKPYTIQVRTSPANPYQRSDMLKGYVLYLQVYSSGYDNSWRGCEVIKQKGNDYYTVNNCPSMYMGCKDIDFECDEEYHGLD